MVEVDDMSVQRLLQKFEHDIVSVNQKNISEIAGDIGQKELLRIGSKISTCRAQYLKLVLDISNIDDSEISVELVNKVRHQRMIYDEMMLSFAALRHALERGYIVVSEE